MTDIVFTLPDEIVPVVVEAFCTTYGYAPMVADPENPDKQIDNPQTPEQFTRECFIKFGKEVVSGYQISKALNSARETATKQVSDLIFNAVITVK